MLDLSDTQAAALVTALICVLTTWMGWRIASRAGFAGAYALVCLVPGLGVLAFLAMLAFNPWPAVPAPRRDDLTRTT